MVRPSSDMSPSGLTPRPGPIQLVLQSYSFARRLGAACFGCSSAESRPAPWSDYRCSRGVGDDALIGLPQEGIAITISVNI